MENAIEEITEVAKSIAEGNLERGPGKDFDGALAKLAVHIEKIRKNLLMIDPKIRDSSDKMPETVSHLLDISNTLTNAADRLMTITEKVMDNQDRGSSLLSGLPPQSDEKARDSVEELKRITMETRKDMTEIFTSLSFQDLAGQKIKKMNEIIADVEARILEILIVFGHRDGIDKSKQGEMLKELQENKGTLKQDLVDDILSNLGL